MSNLKLLNLIFATFLLFAFCFLLLTPGAGAIEVTAEACKQAPNSAICQAAGTTDNPVVRVINIVVSLIALVAGVVAVIMLIIGGFNFITAGGATPGQRAGDPNKIKTAQQQILYSLVGLIVIALAWAATRFITDRVIQ